jgi:hypothetical protein
VCGALRIRAPSLRAKVTAPAIVNVSRKHSYRVIARKECFKSAPQDIGRSLNGATFRNIILGSLGRDGDEPAAPARAESAPGEGEAPASE